MTDQHQRLAGPRDAPGALTPRSFVIDSGAWWDDELSRLEECLNTQGGARLTELLHQTIGKAHHGAVGKAWDQQSVQERQHFRTLCRPHAGPHIVSPSQWVARQRSRGVDFSVVLPRVSLSRLPGPGGAAERVQLQGALNQFQASQWQAHRDAVAPVAGVSMNTPHEALKLLEHAVGLGFKAISLPGSVSRPVPALADKFPLERYPELRASISYEDFYGLDSPFDYDPFWARVESLGMLVFVCGDSRGWTGRRSISNPTHNEIGHAAEGAAAFAKALFFGGVTRRFPNLRIGLLGGGAHWGASLRDHLTTHWVRQQTAENARLQAEFLHGDSGVRDGTQDDFIAAGIHSEADIQARWSTCFFFGVSDPRLYPSGEAGSGGLEPVHGIQTVYASLSSTHPVDGGDPSCDSLWLRSSLSTTTYRLFTEAHPDFFEGTMLQTTLREAHAA